MILGIEQDENLRSLNKDEIFMINAKLSISKSKTMETNLEITFERELRIRNKLD